MDNPYKQLQELEQKKQKIYKEVEENCIPLVDLRNKIVKDMGLDRMSLNYYQPMWEYPDLSTYFGGIRADYEGNININSGDDTGNSPFACIPMEMYMNPTEKFIREYYGEEVKCREEELKYAEELRKEKREAKKRIFRGELSA